LVTHFVAGLGTGGTFVGTGRRLREHNPSVTLVSVQPDSPLHGLEGLKHMESAIVPGIYDATLADADVGVSTEAAYAMTKRLAVEEGLLVGISSGANLAGALKFIEQRSAELKPGPRSNAFGQDASARGEFTEGPRVGRDFSPAGAAGPPVVMVIIFPDGGERYLSHTFWTEDE
jgi:cysteine synthase